MANLIDVLVIGHMTADLVPGGRMLGGTVSYAAPTYAAFGHKIGVLTSAAYNEPLLKHLLPYGKLMVIPADDSLTYENIYTNEDREQYVRATAHPIVYTDIPIGWVDASYVHLGPLAEEVDPAEMAKKLSSATVMLTLQGLMRRWDADGKVHFKRWFDEEAFKQIDIIVYSEEDIQQYPKLTEEISRIANHLVVTNGRDGGTYYYNGDTMHYDSVEVKPRDLTGAGDVFAASLLGVLPLVDNDVAKAVKIAGHLAAYSVARTGVESAPTQDEITRVLEQFK
jgi:hypothetical protein